MFFNFHPYLGADPFQYTTLEIRNLECHPKGDPFKRKIIYLPVPAFLRGYSLVHRGSISQDQQTFQVPKMDVFTYAVCVAYVRENPSPK